MNVEADIMKRNKMVPAKGRGNCIHGIQCCLALLFCISIWSPSLRGQPPGWTAPNPGDYAVTANVVLVLHHDGVRENNPENQVAFFMNGQLRGLGFPLQIDTFGIVYFATVYANTGAEEMEIQVYLEDADQVFTAIHSFPFVVHEITGTLEDPYVVYTFTDGDAPVSLLPFPDVTIYNGIPADSIDLAPYLISLDQDDVLWSYEATPEIDVTIVGSKLFIQPVTGYTGSLTLTITATELTILSKSASGEMMIDVLPAIGPPEISTLPGEGILLNEMFTPFALRDFLENPEAECLLFEYEPVLMANPMPVTPPAWSFTGYFPNTMTIALRPVFTPEYVFSHPNDKIAAFINGQIRGVASPVIIDGEVMYHLSIAGGATPQLLEFQLYSGEYQKIYTVQPTFRYEPYRIAGSADTPQLLDFSPLLPMIDTNGQVQILIQDTTWTGEQVFEFIVHDCQFPAYLSDTSAATFCISADSMGYERVYRDVDGDGFGDPAFSRLVCQSDLSGWVSNADDCFDSGVTSTCQYTASANVPLPINVDFPDTIISTLDIQDYGIITSINVNNLRVNHTSIGDLRISLISPSGTRVLLIDQRCGGNQNMLLDLDSGSSHPYNDIPCPPAGGFCYQALEDLSVLEGENMRGTWTLYLEDLANGDGGSLQSWGIQVCSVPCPEPGIQNIYTGISGAWQNSNRWSLGHPATACEHAIINLNQQHQQVTIPPDYRIDLYRLTIQKGTLVLPASSRIQVRE